MSHFRSLNNVDEANINYELLCALVAHILESEARFANIRDRPREPLFAFC